MKLEILELDIYKTIKPEDQMKKVWEEFGELKNATDFSNLVEELQDVIQVCNGALQVFERDGAIILAEAWQKHRKKLLDRQNAKGGGKREG